MYIEQPPQRIESKSREEVHAIFAPWPQIHPSRKVERRFLPAYIAEDATYICETPPLSHFSKTKIADCVIHTNSYNLATPFDWINNNGCHKLITTMQRFNWPLLKFSWISPGFSIVACLPPPLPTCSGWTMNIMVCPNYRMNLVFSAVTVYL